MIDQKDVYDVATVLIGAVTLLITVVNNLDIIKLTKYAHRQELRVQVKELMLNAAKIASEIYLLEWSLDNESKSQNNIRLNNARNERAVLIEQVSSIVKEYPDIISAVEYSELAKNKFAMFDLELAEKYHLLAIKLSKGIAQINAKRYYADFLYRISRHKEAKDKYRSCLYKKPTTDTQKIINGVTYKMWMNNELFEENLKEADKYYKEAKRSFQQLSQIKARDHYMTQLNIDAVKLLENTEY